MAPQVWLVTGTTSGIGKAVVQELLRCGDSVIATGRNVEARLGPLLQPSSSLRLLELDITSDLPTLTTKIHHAWSLFGHIDVILHNAGVNQLMSAEEATEEHIQTLLTTNLLAPLRLTQALLPLMRPRRTGTLAFISSSSAWTPLPFMSVYAASKAGLSAYVEALHKEIRPLGLRAVAVELGGFPTSLSHPREGGPAPPAPTMIGDYAAGLGELGGMFGREPEKYMPGDLSKGAKGIVDVVKGEGVVEGRKWAVRVVLGSDAHAAVGQKVREVGGLLEEWKEVSWSTDAEGAEGGATREFLEAVSILERE